MKIKATRSSQFEERGHPLKLNGPDCIFNGSAADAVWTRSERAVLCAVPLSDALKVFLLSQLGYFLSKRHRHGLSGEREH